jgi:hypothetical protein
MYQYSSSPKLLKHIDEILKEEEVEEIKVRKWNRREPEVKRNRRAEVKQDCLFSFFFYLVF